MAKYLLLKHYRGAPAAVNDVPMDRWTPEEIDAHVAYMDDFAARLEGTGEFVDVQALSPEGTFVRWDGEGRPPVTDGPRRGTSAVRFGDARLVTAVEGRASGSAGTSPREKSRRGMSRTRTRLRPLSASGHNGRT